MFEIVLMSSFRPRFIVVSVIATNRIPGIDMERVYLGFIEQMEDPAEDRGKLSKAFKPVWYKADSPSGSLAHLKNTFIIDRELMCALFTPSLPIMLDWLDQQQLRVPGSCCCC